MGYNDDHQIAHIRLDRLKELQEKAKKLDDIKASGALSANWDIETTIQKAKKWDELSIEPIDTAFKKAMKYDKIRDILDQD